MSTQIAKQAGHGSAVPYGTEVARNLQQTVDQQLAGMLTAESLPSMLIMAPKVAQLLGDIKLLAFSDNALAIKLKRPDAGFKYLKHTRLPSAIMQILYQATDSFDLAERNIRTIRTKTQLMFGPTGHVEAILHALKDPRRAQMRLLPSMEKFRDEMNNCVVKAQDIDSEFNKLIKFIEEVSSAMADEAGSAAEEMKSKETQQLVVKLEQERREQVISELQEEVAMSKQDLEVAKSNFDKAAKKGETSAFALAGLRSAGNITTNLLSSSINLIQETPRMTIETVQAVGRFLHFTGGSPGSISYEQKNTNYIPKRERNPFRHKDPRTDVYPDVIEKEVRRLSRILEQDHWTDIQEAISGIRKCAQELKKLEQRLKAPKSEQAETAKEIVDQTIGLTDAILKTMSVSSPKKSDRLWTENIPSWQADVKSVLGRATVLRSYVANGPAQSCEAALEAAINSTQGSDSTYSQVLQERYQSLLIMRSAMSEAQKRMSDNRELQISEQTRLSELTTTLQKLKLDTLNIEQTKEILIEATGALDSMRGRMRQLCKFFEILADIIEQFGQHHAQMYLDTIDANIDRNGSNLISLREFNETEVRIISQTVVTLREHFLFTIRSTELYQTVASTFINPCITMAAELSLSASPEDQQRAMNALADKTNEAVRKIESLATEAFASSLKKSETRVKEIDEELGKISRILPSAGNDVENLEAIEEGAQTAREEVQGSEPGASRKQSRGRRRNGKK